MSLAELTQDLLARCAKVSDLIYAGRYEEAREVLGEAWRGVGVRPDVSSYPLEIAAEVLMQCGRLSGFLGNARAKDVQERARDLLTEALHIFQSLDNRAKVSEAQYELSICYFRNGAYDEARIILYEALTDATPELQARSTIGKALLEIYIGRYEEAQNILNEARPLLETASHAFKGMWHGHMGLVLRRLAQGRIEFLDKAIIEFTAAICHYEEAGHERYCGSNLNNLAMLLYKLGRYQEAYEYLDKAHRIFTRLKDPGNIAQVEETRAQALLAEERYEEANRVIVSVVNTLERGGEQAFLADALTIKATVQARLRDYDRSLDTFRRTINLAENAGALCHAGRAAISMIEEHGAARLPEREIYQAYRRADKLLATTQDAEDIARLRACARIVIRKLFGPDLDEYFTLPETVLQYEARFIEQALKEERGSISRAARRLGLSHQTLGAMLKTRHRNLRSKRGPEIKRKKSIIKRR
ncbi:MAG TPA: tetratricopeptide repeat protein [Pyrinomonadaceae bacterium]|jgi:tetratricopeptide (TPR) repeat protein|nr:tetratricopeptide repeat protein [Pyrinomonadaceae bacterium]